VNDNVEALRRMFEAVGNDEDRQPVRELLDPEVEFIVHGKDPRAGRYHGLAGVREFFDGWAEAWEEWQIEVQRIEAVGDDSVAVDILQRARGRGSGAEVENRPAQLWTFRDGRVIRWEIFPSFDEAVAAGRATS
jgi:ketosteroid isomerase-like protein